MSKKSDTRKNVVVVGGGSAGASIILLLAKALDLSAYNLVLVTPRPYYVHLIATLRMLVTDEGKIEDKALIPYDKLASGLQHVQSSVTAIEEAASGQGGVLQLSNGERLEYAALVLASGSIWSGLTQFGDTDEEVREHIAQWRARFAAAKNIVIAGAGAVGLEVAGEVKEYYPTTKVTIVHSDRLPLNDVYPDKYRKNMEQRTRAIDVDFIFNDYIDEFPEPGTTVDLRTRNGKTIPNVDLVVPAFGSKPNTAFISTLDSGVLTATGHVKVKPTLEVQGHPGVFAIGDIMDWVEQKQAAKAATHAAVAAANIVSFLNGRPQTKLYKGSPEMTVIPLGKSGGAGYLGFLWGIQLGAWLSSLLKGKDLMVGRARAMMGYKS